MGKWFDEDRLHCQGDSDASIEQYGRACGCNFSVGEAGIHPGLLALLDEIGEHFQSNVAISCGFRCPTHDFDVGGVGNAHTRGEAADIYIDGISVDELADAAEALMADGVGRYYGDEFVHVDVRDGRVGAGYSWTDQD